MEVELTELELSFKTSLTDTPSIEVDPEATLTKMVRAAVLETKTKEIRSPESLPWSVNVPPIEKDEVETPESLVRLY